MDTKNKDFNTKLGYRSEADVIDEVVDRVSLEINPKTLNVAKYPVGLDSRVECVTSLFNSETKGVTRIGIHGMGGVGKTTLAKAVYNKNYQRFQGSSFLANVREVSRTEKGLVCLQQQLINDVLKCKNIMVDNVDQGIELIRARMCWTKVFIVIDDLEDPKPLEFLEGPFALGSMIVITTRNEDLLDSIKVQARYKANELDDDESRQLFAQHAFGENKIPDTLTELSKEILKRAGGLPLALKVFGSNLLNQAEEEWRWFIDKLSRVPIDDIEKKLMISFDALKSVDPMLQEIFLDIACFYIGQEKEGVVRIIRTCYTFVNRNIDILIKRCLLTINDRDELWMHDLLQDMGRTIACRNSPDEPEKHSRLWVLQDIHNVLKKQKGTEAIQGIISSNYHYENALDEGASFAAETFKRMSKLRFLYLNNVNLTGSFEHTFEDLRWFCWKHFPLNCLPSGFYAQKLVTLELPHSKMRTMWEPNMVPQVFENLKTLDISNSQNLTTTPDFSRLPCLETLNLEDCRSLEDVHISIGSLASLVYLNLGYCENLKSLPDSICRLRALEVLTITLCSSLKALPRNLGNIESLKVLDAHRLESASKLPDSIGLLSNLVELRLGGNKKLETLPDICNLRSLEFLDISYCGKLEELPDQVGKITSLRKLKVEEANLLKKLPDLSQLANIEELVLTGCRNLMSIAELPPNLKLLGAEDCPSIKTLPNLSNLKQLSVLDLRFCSALTEIQGLEELTSLKNLDIIDCGNLLSIPELAPNLEWIKIVDCTSIERLPNLSNLKQLLELDIESCNALTEIMGLEGLTSDEDLYMLPPNLIKIRAKACTSLRRLPRLSNLKQLERLDLTYSSGLIAIVGLEELTSLRELKLTGCSSSLLACTLTKCIFQILSGFGHQVRIYLEPTEFPDWICQSRNFQSKMTFDLPPDVYHNFLGMIFAFKQQSEIRYSVKNITTDSLWVDNFYTSNHESDAYHVENLTTDSQSWMVIVPRSIFSIRDDCDNKIEVTLNEGKIHGIHLLYKSETTMTGEYGSSTVNVKDDRSNLSVGDSEGGKNLLSLASGTTTINVEEERSHPSKRLKRSECDNTGSLSSIE